MYACYEKNAAEFLEGAAGYHGASLRPHSAIRSWQWLLLRSGSFSLDASRAEGVNRDALVRSPFLPASNARAPTGLS